MKDYGELAYVREDELFYVREENFYAKNRRYIVEQFANLDHLITLHQRKCEKLKNSKKSMREKLFV